MVASSEQHNAPVTVNKPATAHARRSQPGAPLNRDDSAEVIKMPDPIIEPITIIVASIGPSARRRLDCWRFSRELLISWLVVSTELGTRNSKRSLMVTEIAQRFNAGFTMMISRVPPGTTEGYVSVSFVLPGLLNV